jgi:hypothetical protein
MIEIKYREFQRRFCELRGEEMMVYGKGGEVVGHWVPGVKVGKGVGHVEGSEEVEVVGQDIGNVSDKDEKRERFEELKRRIEGREEEMEEREEVKEEYCGKCKNKGVVGYWNGYNDVLGEEILNMPVCSRCAKVCKVGIKYI